MTEYQRGIYDLQTLLRKYGCILVGDIGITKGYHAFLAQNGIKMRKPTKSQVETLGEYRTLGTSMRALLKLVELPEGK